MQATKVCISLIQEGNGALRFNDLNGKKMIMLFHFPGPQQGDKADHSRPQQTKARRTAGEGAPLSTLSRGNRFTFSLQIPSSSVPGGLRWLAVFAQAKGSWRSFSPYRGLGRRKDSHRRAQPR